MTIERLGPYLVLSVMGQGGTGIVTKCRHERTGGLLAVKRARDTSGLQRDLLRKEISMLSRLGRTGHPAVVRVVESGNAGGLLWYAMEYIDGPDLADVMQYFRRGVMEDVAPTETAGAASGVQENESLRTEQLESAAETARVVGGHARSYRPLETPPHAIAERVQASPRLMEALDVLKRVAESIAFIHEEGLIHGDIKPKNLMFREDGSSVIVDFGAALYAFAGAAPREVAQVERIRHGTPGYMAPEQILGEPLDARCDLYALGCILYEVATGRRPFVANDIVSLQNQHLHVEPLAPSSSCSGLPDGLDDLVLGLLAKDPRKRVGYAADVVSALNAMLGRRPSSLGNLGSPRHLYRPRVAGRCAELERLGESLARARAGAGGIMFVSGESGVGKTRLVNELSGVAVGTSMAVVVGQCSEISQASGRNTSLRGAALQPFIPLFHRLIDRCSVDGGERLAEELTQSLAALAPYETSLLELPAIAAYRLCELPHALARARVFRSLTEVLRRLAAERPLLMILDDLHWADDLTLAFLRSKAAVELDTAAVLLIGTFREEQVDDALRAAAQAAPEKLVRLARLDLEATRSMAKDMLASELMPEGLEEFLHHHSEGNPFFAAEYLRAAIERGVLSRAPDGRWAAPALSSDEFAPSRDSSPPPLPSSLQDLLQLRLEGLSTAAASLLQLISVLGREIELEHLEAFRGELAYEPMGDDALAIEELVARQILEESGPVRYRFVHDKLREAAEAGIPPEQRKSLHAGAARRLERVATDGTDSQARDAQLGHHWAYAGEPVRALPYLERAAHAAAAMHSHAQAIELYLLAISQAEALGSRTELAAGTFARLGEGVADVLVQVARHADARRYYDWAVSRGGTDRLTSARIHRKKAQSFWTQHEYDAASAALDRAAAHIGDRDALRVPEDLREWFEIQLGSFWRYYFARQTGEHTRAIIESMQTVVEGPATPVQRSVYYVCAALDLLGRSRYAYSAEAVHFTRQAIAVIADGPAFLAQISLSRFNLGFALLLGDRESQRAAVLELEQTARDADRMGDVTLLSRALTYLAVGYRRLGDVTATLRVGERALRASEDARLAPYIGAATACLAWTSWKQNDLVAAERRARESRRWWESSHHDFPFRWLSVLVSVDLDLRREDFDSAREALLQLLEPNQQALPHELNSALERLAGVQRGDYSELAATIQRILMIAERLGYL